MYNTKHKTKKFNTDDEADLTEYDKILNDPLCTILSEKKEKLKLEEYDNEGNMIHMEEKIILVVTWDQKVLA